MLVPGIFQGFYLILNITTMFIGFYGTAVANEGGTVKLTIYPVILPFAQLVYDS